MKSRRITLVVAAIALGTFKPFSFAPANTEAKFTLQDFYVNTDGSIGAP
ncbi:hypothetical protein SAMN05660841_02656 [Sphingobacterium nematocida]|uniref:Uncharacterized protein n=1 Tax=Sphingobacterium nematocida TaxID=1513896 RepID=A0A1T5EK36_9SPHI|nr:hypothetical protein [Sphingobacterium nematocida]SKB84412.1 hypothetical protein SAMN05660841_02656 [Sphingobacterium nematocida]